MSSVDGRLLTRRWTKPFSVKDFTPYIETYENVSRQFNATAWMIGRTTVQQDFDTGAFDVEKYEPAKIFETYTGNRTSAISAIILDPKGKTSYYSDNLNGDNIIAVLGETVSEAYLSHLRENGVSYLFAGKDGRDLQKAMEILYRDFGQQTILLEGGGMINGAFLKAGLIDELSIMVYPALTGWRAFLRLLITREKMENFRHKVKRWNACRQKFLTVVWYGYVIKFILEQINKNSSR